VLTAYIFSEELDGIFRLFDPEQPLVVINEGLINYFDQNMLGILLQGIADNARHFPALHYLSDIYPEPVKNRLANFIWSCSRLLKFMSRSAFSFHFKSPQQLQQFFQEAGFDQVLVQQPQRYFARPSQQNPIPAQDQHLGDLVWMIHAVKKNSVI
ncbi:MAG: leucine carboxyl methyltransferase, partial [Acinetobacter sp.]